jgi:hypothetical protein
MAAAFSVLRNTCDQLWAKKLERSSTEIFSIKTCKLCWNPWKQNLRWNMKI